MLEPVAQQAHTLHLSLKLSHSVVLHAPPLERRIIWPSSCNRRSAGRRTHVEGEGGRLGMRALEADSNFGRSLHAKAAGQQWSSDLHWMM